MFQEFYWRMYMFRRLRSLSSQQNLSCLRKVNGKEITYGGVFTTIAIMYVCEMCLSPDFSIN